MNEKQMEIQKFQKLARVLNVILKVVNWVLIISFGVCLIGLILVNIIPTPLYNELLTIDSSPWFHYYGNLEISIENNHFSTLAGSDMKYLFSMMCLAGGLMMGIAFAMVLFVRSILNQVIEENPFGERCIQSMFRLGILVIIGGTISQNMMNLLEYAGFEALNLSQYFSDNVHLTLEIQFFDGVTVLVGLGIILFSYIFKYASYLQEEVDATI